MDSAFTALRALLLATLISLAGAGAAEARTAYVTALVGDSVTPIDTLTSTTGSPFAIAAPRGIAITPDGATAFVVNQDVDTTTPVDTATTMPGAPIATGAQPLAVAIAPDGATAYVVDVTTNGVFPIDVGTATVGPPIGVGLSPRDLAISPDGETVYVTNGNSNNVTPIDTATNTPGTPIPVGALPWGIAIAPDGATAYVANRNSNNVTPIDTATNTPGTPIPAGDGPYGIAITPDGETVYVANGDGNDVTPIDTATNTPGTPIPVGGDHPSGIAITPDGATAYVANTDSDDVTLVDVASNSPVGTLAVGNEPWAVAITPNQPPAAAFDATLATAGSATTFDASGSTDGDGAVATYEWDFGDGEALTTTDATVGHVYADPGEYTATLTVTDDEGCSTTFVFTGQTASCNGSGVARGENELTIPAVQGPAATTTPMPTPSAPPSTRPSAPPAVERRGRAIERFSLAARCVRPSATGEVRVRVSLRVARSGPVQVKVQRAIGTKARRSCPAPGGKRRFTGRFRTVKTLKRVKTRAATAAVTRQLTLRLRLEPGLYRIAVRAQTANGKLSRPAHRFLRVLGTPN